MFLIRSGDTCGQNSYPRTQVPIAPASHNSLANVGVWVLGVCQLESNASLLKQRSKKGGFGVNLWMCRVRFPALLPTDCEWVIASRLSLST